MHNHLISIDIKDLRLRTYIGFNEEEKIKKQDVVLNIEICYNAQKAMISDDVTDAFNYKVLTKQIIAMVESQRFNLLEKMAADIMSMIEQEQQILTATITIDKPHALRFTESVSVKLSYHKS